MKHININETDPASTSAGIENQNNGQGSGCHPSETSGVMCHFYAPGECRTFAMRKPEDPGESAGSIEPLLESGRYRVSLRGPGVCPFLLKTESVPGGLFLTLGIDEEPLVHYGVATDQESSVIIWDSLEICHSMARLADASYPTDCPRPRAFPWVAMVVTPDGPLAKNQIEAEKIRPSDRAIARAAAGFELGMECHFLGKTLIWLWLERIRREKDSLG